LRSLVEWFRRLEDVDGWRRLVPWLSITDDAAWEDHHAVREAASTAAATLRGRIVAQGYVRAEGLIDGDVAGSLTRAMRTLRAEGMHPLFVFVYDEPWRMLSRIVPFVSATLGVEMEAVADFWGWHLTPPGDRAGWSPHRGRYEDVRTDDGLPALVNAWVSLSEVTPSRACMHLVALPDDPGWPHDLSRRPFVLAAGRPEPTNPGTVLLWNANILHWGGNLDPAEITPRVSASFSLARRGWEPHTRRIPGSLSFETRLDLIAEQVLMYGAMELAEAAHLQQWADVRTTMRYLSRGPSRVT
jgi:hypothetical protein